MIRELLAEGKGGSVGDRPEEAGEQNCKPTDRNRTSRLSLWGELAPHSEAFRSGDTVNAAVVQGKSTTLTRGDLIDFASRQKEARWLATAIVFGEKSAEVVVGGDDVGHQPPSGNELSGRLRGLPGRGPT